MLNAVKKKSLKKETFYKYLLKQGNHKLVNVCPRHKEKQELWLLRNRGEAERQGRWGSINQISGWKGGLIHTI